MEENMSALDASSTRPTKKSRLGERTMLACSSCKQRKLKCDGNSPKCENCIKTGRDCLVEDPATGLHRPRNYMQMLEEKVAYLESLLERLQPNYRSEAILGPDGTVQQPISNDHLGGFQVSPGSSGRSPTAGSDTQTSIDHLSSEVALLCLSATGHEPLYFGPSSAVSFSHIASQAMGLRQPFKSTLLKRPRLNSLTRPRTIRHQPPNWPSVEQAHELKRAYFRNIHPQYPFLHQPTLNAWEQECRQARKGPESTFLNHTSTFFTLMVYAIGSLATEKLQADAAESYYASALDYLEGVLDLDGLESIQALLTIALYAIRSPFGVSLWKVTGLVMRQCIQLGYHRSVEKYRGGGDALTREMSKRCFWIAYGFDRYVSCILGLPGAISDLSIDVELPMDVNDDELTKSGVVPVAERPYPTTMTGAIHIIKLRQIWSKFSTHLFPTSSLCSHDHTDNSPSIEELRQELEQWRASAPSLDNQHPDSPLSVFASHGWFQLVYDHSILLLYRHYIMDTKPYKCCPPLPKSPEIIDRAFEECSAKAKDMCLLYRRLYQNASIQFTWGSLHTLFFGGLTYLYCLWRSESIRRATRNSEVVNTTMACQTVLVILAERWKLASSYRDLFQSLSERTISMMCGDLEVQSFDNTSTEINSDAASDPGFSNWASTFEGLDFPSESEWLVSELVNGFEHAGSSDTFDFVDAGQSYGFEADPFDGGLDWNAMR